MRDEGDAQEGQDFTLSGRISRVEKMLGLDEIQRKTTLQDEAEAAWQRSMMDQVGRHTEQAQLRPKELTAFEDIIQRIQSSSDRILSHAVTLEIIADRVMGSLPTKAESTNGKDEACPDGTLDHTFKALNELDQSINRLHFATTRLERV